MDKAGIVAMGVSAAVWASLFVYTVAREPPWLLILMLVAMYGGWTIQTLLHCKCGKEKGA
jgi:hypothetical protein